MKNLPIKNITIKKNRRISLSIKIYNLIILLVFCSALFSIVVSYREHVKTTDEIYEALSSNIAETVSNSLNGTRVRTLVNTCTDSEYQKLLARAREENNSDLIKEYLLDKDLLLTYENIKELLRQFTQYMDVQHIFIEFIGDGELYHIVNPADDYLSFGYREDLYGIYLPYSGQNVSIPPMISRFSDNLVCTCFEPVFDSEGNPVAVVGVELDMRSLIREHRRFGLIIIISALALAALAATLGVFFMRRSVTDPLEKLCSQTRDFSDKQEQYSQSDIINLNIHSGDEIADLYAAIQSMEEKIVRYLDHLIKVTGEEEHARTELNIAAQIQRDMLPQTFPAYPDRDDFDLYASMDPAREVGGDFYDFFLVDDDHLVLIIADVSGKGIPAALFMAIVKSLLKTRASSGESPSKVISRLNDQICKANTTEMFASVWIGSLELSTGILTATNAGHEYPVISRAGKPFELLKDKHNLVMAAMPSVPYSEYRLVLAPGDRLFVYTDGVPEATDPDNKLFGLDRMIEALNSDPDADPERLIRNVTAAIERFVRSAPQFDDTTMLALTYTPDPDSRILLTTKGPA